MTFQFNRSINSLNTMFLNRFYYNIKPLIPRRTQILLRRLMAVYKKRRFQDLWPIDPGSSTPPQGWRGWPANKKFAVVFSHDVDTQKGYGNIYNLIEIEEKLGICSSYNMVPERYVYSINVIRDIQGRGFEVCVHGLNHDGKLFSSESLFLERALKINKYIKEWGIRGFTSPSMHHNLLWMKKLDISHATSTFDTDPFEPQSDPVRTIFPFRVNNGKRGYVELPYTLPQDFTLFVILKEQNIDIWKRKLDWIAEKGGMALLNTHPDYMNFYNKKNKTEEYRVRFFTEFIEYLKMKYDGEYWNPLPKELAEFWITGSGAH